MEKMDSIHNLLAQAVKEHARFERMMFPAAGMAEIVKLSQSSQLNVFSQMAAAIAREHRLYSDFLKPAFHLEEITRQFAQMQAITDGMTAPYREIQAAMRAQSSVFARLAAPVASLDALKFSLPQLSQTALAWNVASTGLLNRMGEIGLLEQRLRLSERLFEAPSAYSHFVKHTSDRLVADASPSMAARLRGSLNLAEDQLLGIADVLSGFIAVPDDEDEPEGVRQLTAPFTQQDELLALPTIEDETDTNALTIASPTAQIVSRCRRVLGLVTLCNEAGKTSKLGVEIFKPTTRLMTVFADFPWLVPTDRMRFADVIDCLYFIFYEGAGKDNLRFMDKHGGPLTDADCDLIWCIKHLRNKWVRHDADHGKEKDIQKSWTELAAKFRWLGLAEHPTDSAQFQHLHRKLLELAEEFLERILSKLSLK